MIKPELDIKKLNQIWMYEIMKGNISEDTTLILNSHIYIAKLNREGFPDNNPEVEQFISYCLKVDSLRYVIAKSEKYSYCIYKKHLL